MKKFILAALVIGFTAACKKDKSEANEPDTYEKRLIGQWDLSAVSYSAQLPSLNPGGPTTPVDGDGEDVTGTFVLKENPNVVEYDYSFTAHFQSIPLPVEQSGKGTWTVSSDDSKLYIELENGETSTMEVQENEENKQVFRSIIPYELPVLGSVDVETVVTFVR